MMRKQRQIKNNTLQNVFLTFFFITIKFLCYAKLCNITKKITFSFYKNNFL